MDPFNNTAYHFTKCIHLLAWWSHAGNGTPNPFLSYYQENLCSPWVRLLQSLPCLLGCLRVRRGPSHPVFLGIRCLHADQEDPLSLGDPVGQPRLWDPGHKHGKKLHSDSERRDLSWCRCQHTGIEGKTSTKLPMTINRLK